MLSHPFSLACSAPTGCSQPIPSLPTKYCHRHCHHRFYRGRNSTLPRSHHQTSCGKPLQPLPSPAGWLDPRRDSASRRDHQWVSSCAPNDSTRAPGPLLEICQMKLLSTHEGSASQSTQLGIKGGRSKAGQRCVLSPCIWGLHTPDCSSPEQMWETHQVMWVLQKKKK